jgi:hypothetical protein
LYQEFKHKQEKWANMDPWPWPQAALLKLQAQHHLQLQLSCGPASWLLPNDAGGAHHSPTALSFTNNSAVSLLLTFRIALCC